MSSVPTTISNKPHLPRGVRVSLNTILDKAMETKMLNLSMGTTMPVSYTHLDVYKRQHQYEALLLKLFAVVHRRYFQLE